jgi:hypothetical protein
MGERGADCHAKSRRDEQRRREGAKKPGSGERGARSGEDRSLGLGQLEQLGAAGSAFHDTRPGAFDAAEVAREVGEAGGSGIRANRLARSIEIEATHLVQREPGNEVQRGGRGFQPSLLELGQRDWLTQARDGVMEHIHVLGGAR